MAETTLIRTGEIRRASSRFTRNRAILRSAVSSDRTIRLNESSTIRIVNASGFFLCISIFSTTGV